MQGSQKNNRLRLILENRRTETMPKSIAGGERICNTMRDLRPFPEPNSRRRAGGPVRGALFDEGWDTLLRNVVDHIAGHRLAGKLISRCNAQLNLAVEQALARRDHGWRLGGDRRRQPVDLLIEA